MDSINTFAGQLTDDPRLTYAPSGLPILTFGVAVNRRTKNDAGEWVDAPPTFKPVKVMGRQAEHVAESATRGTRVVVIGTEETSAWITKDNQDRSQTYTLVSDRFGEIGVSTKFAPADARKAQRSSEQQPANDPWAEPGNA